MQSGRSPAWVGSHLGGIVWIQQNLKWHEENNTIWQAAPLTRLFSPCLSRKGPRWRRFASDAHELWNLVPTCRTTSPNQPHQRLARIELSGESINMEPFSRSRDKKRPFERIANPSTSDDESAHQAPHNIQSGRSRQVKTCQEEASLWNTVGRDSKYPERLREERE